MAAHETEGTRSPWRLVASNGFGMFMLGIALALGGAFASQSLARALVAMRSQSSISVKGSASTDVKADLASWSTTVSVEARTQDQGALRLKEAMERVERYVQGNGFAAEECSVSAVDVRTVMRKNDKGGDTNEVERYELTQRLAVKTAKVEAIERIARSVTDLLRDGVPVASSAPVYTISSIEDHKMRLLDQATRNAMDRARTLASSSGSGVGALLNASQGVVQVLARGAIDGGEWGEYDTSTIDKTMRVVVSLEYAVR